MNNRPPPSPPLDGMKDDNGFTQLAMLMGYSGQAPGVDFTPFIPAPPPVDGSKEKDRIASRLNGFNSKDNTVWKAITQRFGANIKQPELLSMAQVLASHANIKLDRDAKRRKSVLIKWFEENWTAIEPFLQFVVLEDARSSHS
jgi:hypothetical protein